MAMPALLRILQITFSSFLIFKAITQLLTDPDWWIYVPFYGCGAVLCLFPIPKSALWRGLTAMVIVFGGLQVLFTAWSLWYISTITAFEPFPESKHVALTAAAVCLTCGTRLATIQLKGCVSYLKALVLLTILTSSLAAFLYAEIYSTDIHARRPFNKWMNFAQFLS